MCRVQSGALGLSQTFVSVCVYVPACSMYVCVILYITGY